MELIRKFGTVDAPPELVRRIFRQVESWPEWMPGVRATRIRERSEKHILAEVDLEEEGRSRTLTLEFLLDPTGYTERQVSGRAMKYEAKWRFVDAPRDAGTIVSCKLDLKLGLLGLVTPRNVVQRKIDRTFDLIMRNLEQHIPAATKTVRPERKPGGMTPARIRVFATDTELEIWIGDRKYVAYAAD